MKELRTKLLSSKQRQEEIRSKMEHAPIYLDKFCFKCYILQLRTSFGKTKDLWYGESAYGK